MMSMQMKKEEAMHSMNKTFQDHDRKIGVKKNRPLSHYRILPVSRDIGWPVHQLDYFRYMKL